MIEPLIVVFVLILMRVGCFVMVLPILGGQSVPHQVKLGLTVALSVFIFRTISFMPTPEIVALMGDLNWFTVGFALGREAILGAFLGYMLGLILLPVRVGGDYIAQEMGLNAAGQIDPSTTERSEAVTQMFILMASLLFLGLEGHHVLIHVLHASFTKVPLGQGLSFVPIAQMVSGVSSAQEEGLVAFAPLAAILFLTTVVIALLSRAAPQLNVFSLGFGIRAVVGVLGCWFLLPDLLASITRLLHEFSTVVLNAV